MGQKEAAILLTPANGRSDLSLGSRKIVDLGLRVWDEPLQGYVAVANRPARLDELVPLARGLSTRVMELVVRRARAERRPIPCRRGCASCCKYLIPLSSPEAFRLAAEVRSLPAPRRLGLMRSMLAAARRLLEAGPPDLPHATETLGHGIVVSPAGAAGQWYAELDITCPFLVGDACAVYVQRPLACVEHMVTSPPQFCGHFQPGRGSILSPPVSVLEALAILAAEVEQIPLEPVMLPLLPAWCDVNAHRAEATWPATELVERFGVILRRLADQSRPEGSSRHSEAA